MCYPSSNILLSFAKKFDTMINSESMIFRKIWTETLKHVCKSDIAIGDIKAQAWEPTFAKCQEIVNKLIVKSMILTDVYKQFHHCDTKELERKLNGLFHGVDSCLGVTRSSS